MSAILALWNAHLWTAATGMQAQTLNIDVISNNLANVSTSGFKKSRAEFQDLLYETLRPAGVSSSETSRCRSASRSGMAPDRRPSTGFLCRAIFSTPRTS